MGRRLSKIFVSFFKDKFCYNLTYLLQYDILQRYVTYLLQYDILQQYVIYCSAIRDILLQYVTYRCNMSYCAAIYHILLQYITYRCNMSHIVAICHIEVDKLHNVILQQICYILLQYVILR